MKANQMVAFLYRQGKCHPCRPGHRHFGWCESCSTKMTIAKGHQLQCFVGLGKQPLRGTTPIKDCTNEEAVARRECGGGRHRNNRCGCKQLGSLPPSGGGTTHLSLGSRGLVSGSLGGVHFFDVTDSSILKSLSSDMQGPGNL